MTRYRHYDVRRGRVSGSLSPWALNLPRLHVYTDGPEHAGVGFSYGNGNSDPVVQLDLDLGGTRAGRVLDRIDAWLWERRRRRG